MLIAVLGINHKSAKLALREKIAIVCANRLAPKKQHIGHDFILLSTCNRTEVYFSSEDLVATHSYLLRLFRSEIEEEFEHSLYSYFGYDCFTHLCKVIAGLDSALLAETEIQGQVKEAYLLASKHTTLSKDLHFLFQKSLKIAKEVRTAFPRSNAQLEAKVLRLIEEHGGKKILFVGASTINRKLCKALLGEITFCNRSPLGLEIIKQERDVALLPWEERDLWHTFHVVIVATKASGFLLQDREIKNKILLIDLSVPRNIDPSLGKRTTLYNIDQLGELFETGALDYFDRADLWIRSSVARQISLFRIKERRLSHRLALLG